MTIKIMGTTSHIFTVMVARQNAFIRQSLCEWLHTQGYQSVDYANDLVQLVADIPQNKPDFVLLDAEVDGLELCRTIRAMPQIAIKCVLFLTRHSRYLLPSLFADVSGYLYDDASIDEILLCLERLRRGERYINPAMMRQIDRPKVLAYQTTVAPLSEREREVFRYLGYNYSTKQIGDTLCMSGKTVETHLEKMKRKLLLETTKDLRYKAIIAVNNGDT
ncbi:MAG: DNA-binding response regulator [Cytophagia bacterium]|nr:MAG: DNA-binding response regulator [Runella sp.]TAG17063.1 MAG: DNA-binding response regulator [Cytophagales bacterium]TAG36207.1 MAG: DNA-binding response regulator [Cytophagia bacterium]TAG77785.1 MAG: DNA-binding response regulator [Cytophagales bacterium]